MTDQKEYENHGTKEDEDGEGMDEETFTHQEFLQGPIEGMAFISKDSMFAFYREHTRFKEFGMLKKTSINKSGDTINYVVFACDEGRKGKQKKQSKRVQRLSHCELSIHQDVEIVDGVEKIGDAALDSDVKIRDFKNVMKVRLVAYLNWEDDMIVPDVGGDDSNNDDLTYIRNTREVRSRGRPPTNRHRRGRENIFRQGGGRVYNTRTGPNINIDIVS
ncbi:hypothetical protein RND71_013089 [Anisodus tanguticus]|uniref:Uncharacterized protein n=1 Tax=Anisodus tanguticus TaxID=243964 RepID=A0AAE1SGM3_9SOLA|nr:hypothetical protein RND71_013089 [Anisodus tanguticus]